VATRLARLRVAALYLFALPALTCQRLRSLIYATLAARTFRATLLPLLTFTAQVGTRAASACVPSPVLYFA